MIGQGHRSLLSEMECEEGVGTTTATLTNSSPGDELTQVISRGICGVTNQMVAIMWCQLTSSPLKIPNDSV